MRQAKEKHFDIGCDTFLLKLVTCNVFAQIIFYDSATNYAAVMSTSNWLLYLPTPAVLSHWKGEPSKLS